MKLESKVLKEIESCYEAYQYACICTSILTYIRVSILMYLAYIQMCPILWLNLLSYLKFSLIYMCINVNTLSHLVDISDI